MYIMIICHLAILHYNMSFKTIAGRSDGVFWWFPVLSEDREKNCWIHQNYLVASNLTIALHFNLFPNLNNLRSSINNQSATETSLHLHVHFWGNHFEKWNIAMRQGIRTLLFPNQWSLRCHRHLSLVGFTRSC